VRKRLDATSGSAFETRPQRLQPQSWNPKITEDHPMSRHLPSLRAVTLLTLTTMPVTAHAGQSRPYTGAFDFAVLDIQPVSQTGLMITASLAGHETFLGQFKGTVVYVVDLTNGTFSGSLVKQAANGDLLYETLTGHFTATGSEGDFNLNGGTGRFLHAAGGGTYVNVWTSQDMTTGHVTFSGAIDFDASDRRH
jgi:hypothetical protein